MHSCHRVMVGLAAAALLWAVWPAHAADAVWAVEEAKARADVILIARMGASRPIAGPRGLNRMASFSPVTVLKGAPLLRDGNTGRALPDLKVLYLAKPPWWDEETDLPGRQQYLDIPAGQMALVFLRAEYRRGEFSVVMGESGYIPLTGLNFEQATEVRARIARYRSASLQVPDPSLRSLLESAYRRAIEVLDARP